MSFPTPQHGASLLLAHRLSAPTTSSSSSSGANSHRRTVVIVGTSRLAASRLYACAEAGAWPVIVVPHNAHLQTVQEEEDAICPEIKHRLQNDECSLIHFPPPGSEGCQADSEEAQWDRLLDVLDSVLPPDSPYGGAALDVSDQHKARVREYSEDVQRRLRDTITKSATKANDPQIFALCVTNTLHSSTSAAREEERASDPISQAQLLARLCRRRRIPITVADRPELCDFSFPASHRFMLASDASSQSSSERNTSRQKKASCLQVAVTTNGKGCRLAGRIRREIVTLLPKNVADAVENIGMMRGMAKARDSDPEEQQKRRERSRSRSRSIGAQAREQEGKESRTHLNGGGSSVNGNDHTATRRPPSIAEGDDESFDPTPINSPVPQLHHKGSSSPLNSYFAVPTKADQTLLSRAVNASLTQAQAQAQKGDQFSLPTHEHEQQPEPAAEDDERTKRRMRWVAQMSEYWPIDYLGRLDREKMQSLLDEYHEREENGTATPTPATVERARPAANVDALAEAPNWTGAVSETEEEPSRGRLAKAEADAGSWAQRRPSQHSLILPPPPASRNNKGHIYILGSGPGHPALLTFFAYKLLTSPDTHLVLSDKLVPSPILALIPPSTPLVIARKFPGNAEGAQSELIALALQAAVKEGKNVVRLKQGDPFVYGRGGEEVLAFRKAGVESTVVPGISSSLAGPALLGMAVTQRGAADSMILCTGVGRGGKKVTLPGYERARSLVLLMGVARLQAVVDILTKPAEGIIKQGTESDRGGAAFPPYLPIAVVERASSADQRVIASTLDGIVSAIEQVGEQRPPGMIIIGWSVLALEGAGDTSTLDDADSVADAMAGGVLSKEQGEEELKGKDLARVARWLNGQRFLVREGLDQPYTDALRQVREEASAVADWTHRDLQESIAKAETEATRADSLGVRNPAVGQRGAAGWAEGRYRGDAPEGGWMAGEGENRPAVDMQQYLTDFQVPETIAR